MQTISDSVALKIINDNNVLAGVGNEIRHYTKGSSTTLPFKLKGKIHGIETHQTTEKFLIYGENEFIFIQQNNSAFKLLYRGCLSDWISSGKLLHEEGTFILVTAHSVALHLKYNDESKSCEIREKISCTDKSTLYCSYIYGTSWEDSLIFGGNAFGELLVWQPKIKNDEEIPKAKLLQRRPCHNGVIFSIDLDMEAKVLVTTSDDRSVRFWDILLEEGCDFDKATISNPKSGYSHVARVFKAKIIREGGEIFVLTGGEDSFFCLWNRNGELLFKRRQQFGATIWTLDYHSSTKTLITAGSSGNILNYGLQDCFKQHEFMSASILNSHSLESNEYIGKIKFLNEKNLIGISNRNCLMHRQIDKEWIPVNSFVPSKSTVLETYSDLIAIAGYQTVSLYKFIEDSMTFEKIVEGNVLPGVVRSIIFLSRSEFLVSDESGNCKLIRLESFDDSLSISLPQCKERWITAACRVDSEFLIVSNRQGSLMLYSTLMNPAESKLCDIIKRLHGHLGCTTITLVRDNNSSCILKTTGHDYSVKTIKLDKKRSTISVLSREIIPIAWVEKIITSPDTANELLFGFNDNHFVLWSREVDTHFEIACGGGHRCWDLHIDLSKNFVQMVFIKNKQVILQRRVVFNQPALTFSMPRNKWHVKPCNVLSCFQSKELYLVVSGGDDNTLKISQLKVKSGILTQLHEIHSHISSIRGLSVAWNASPGKHLIFSCGGRAQICVTAFHDNNDEGFEEIIDYTILKEAKSQDIRCDPETRVMSIAVRQLNADSFDIFVGCSDGYVRRFSMEKSNINHVSEVFYGKCILHVRLAGDYLLSVATDGMVCFWNINNFENVFKIAHHESGVNSFDVRITNDSEFHLLTGGDDQDVVYSKVDHSTGKLNTSILKRMNYLHTAQVTAVKFTPCMGYFYSSSVDQIVRKVNLKTFDSNWESLSCVADVKGIELVEKSDNNLLAFIYGCGLQVF